MGLYFAASYGHREFLNANRVSHLKGNVRYKQNNRGRRNWQYKDRRKKPPVFFVMAEKVCDNKRFVL